MFDNKIKFITGYSATDISLGRIDYHYVKDVIFFQKIPLGKYFVAPLRLKIKKLQFYFFPLRWQDIELIKPIYHPNNYSYRLPNFESYENIPLNKNIERDDYGTFYYWDNILNSPSNFTNYEKKYLEKYLKIDLKDIKSKIKSFDGKYESIHFFFKMDYHKIEASLYLKSEICIFERIKCYRVYSDWGYNYYIKLEDLELPYGLTKDDEFPMSSNAPLSDYKNLNNQSSHYEDTFTHSECLVNTTPSSSEEGSGGQLIHLFLKGYVFYKNGVFYIFVINDFDCYLGDGVRYVDIKYDLYKIDDECCLKQCFNKNK